MKPLTPQKENIPEELKAIPHWVNWKLETRDGKLTKPPYNAKTGGYAKANDPETWSDFKTAFKTYESNGHNGIGFVLSEDDPFVGFDLDHCRNPETKKIEKWAQIIVENLNTYTEISPSGCGLRGFLEGKLPPEGRKKGNIEFYETHHYLTLTGRILKKDVSIENRQAELLKVHKDVFGKTKTKDRPADYGKHFSNPGAAVLLNKAFQSQNGAKIQKLYHGNWSDYPSQSEADQALCFYLAFWFDNDSGVMDEAFRNSGLMREKWNKQHYGDGQTYGAMTIQNAINHTSETYQPGKASREPIQKENEGINILDALNSNEDGDALLFQERQQGKFIYDHSLQTWFYFTGHSWNEDTTDKTTAVVQSIIDPYVGEAQIQAGAKLDAVKVGNSELTGQCGKLEGLLLKRIRALQTIKRKAAVLNLSARIGSKPLCVAGNEWDTDPWLVGCKNGVIDLKTGAHRPGRPEDYIKTTAPVDWSGLDAPCPQWEKFILEIFDDDGDLADYVQRLLGYGLTGLNVIHIYVIMWGLGRNGKGTLLETLKHVLGDLAYKAEAELLLDQKFGRQGGTPNTGTLQLRGKRIVWASETNEGRRLNTGKLKELVGGDTLNARPMYGKRHIEFSPTHLLLLLTNNKPQAPANDYALWQRISLIPFVLSFVANPTKPNERKADLNLIEKLKSERSGILAWLVRGCLKWQAEGLDAPEAVKIATNEYREDEDLISKFITECCVVGETYEVKAGVLYQAYKTWCTDQGHYAINGTRFGLEIKKKYDSDKSQYVYYIGLGLIHD